MFSFPLKDVSEFCKIECMPTFHFYKNGEKVRVREWTAENGFKLGLHNTLYTYHDHDFKMWDIEKNCSK